jgi:hypothetical protein
VDAEGAAFLDVGQKSSILICKGGRVGASSLEPQYTPVPIPAGHRDQPTEFS